MSKTKALSIAGAVVLILLAIAICIPGISGIQHIPPARAIPAALVTIKKAQEDIHHRTPPAPYVPGYWQRDITGLYFAKGWDGVPVRLIMPQLAAADDRPVTEISPPFSRRPYCHYWFRAQGRVEDLIPNPDRYWVCAFPEVYEGDTKLTYLMDQTGTIYKKDLGGSGVYKFPDDPRAEGWVDSD